MSTLALPARAKPVIALAISLLVIAIYQTCQHPAAGVLLTVLALLLSGFVADAFTGLAHFGFDYVFPHDTPVLGPIAFEFNEHHAEPTLDPSSYVENFTKGAYASLPVSLIVLLLLNTTGGSGLSFFLVTSLLGMAIWALFFHQIHAYAHMGSTLSPEVFKERMRQIGNLASVSEQRRELEELFATVPIPRPVRLLQKCRLILSPERHNLHHLDFESDFSSVNGWSDPVLNLFLGPIARRYKLRRALQPATARDAPVDMQGI